MDERRWKASSKKDLGCTSGSASFTPSSSPSKQPPTRLLRSCSVSGHKGNAGSSSSKSPLLRSFSQKGGSISRKCSSLAKEHKARFYIMRRCVAMLACWHKHSDP